MKQYQKPTVQRVKVSVLVLRRIKTNKGGCRQCSGCHGCR